MKNQGVNTSPFGSLRPPGSPTALFRVENSLPNAHRQSHRELTGSILLTALPRTCSAFPQIFHGIGAQCQHTQPRLRYDTPPPPRHLVVLELLPATLLLGAGRWIVSLRLMKM